MLKAAGSAHKIVVCTDCRLAKRSEKRGHIVIQKIKRILELADHSISSTFHVSGEACLAGCEHPCTVAFLCQSKTNYLFGGIQTDAEIAAIVAFADQYCRSKSGWTRSQDRPDALRGKTLARLPALTTILETKGGRSP